MDLENNEIVQKFLDTFCYPKYLDFFLNEVIKKKEILINDPSNICAIIRTNNLSDKYGYSEWENWSYNGFKPKKDETNYILINNHFYSCFYILKILEFLNDKTNFDIKTISIEEADYHCLLFKIDGNYSIGIANIMYTTLQLAKNGVYFIKTDYKPNKEGELEEYEVGRNLVEWENNKALFVDKYNGRKWIKVVYNQNYFLEKQEDVGDSLLI